MTGFSSKPKKERIFIKLIILLEGDITHIHTYRVRSPDRRPRPQASAAKAAAAKSFGAPVCTYVRMYVCMYVPWRLCTYVLMYLCTYVYVRAYVRTYVYGCNDRMYLCM